jgi:hypothetical protein
MHGVRLTAHCVPASFCRETHGARLYSAPLGVAFTLRLSILNSQFSILNSQAFTIFNNEIGKTVWEIRWSILPLHCQVNPIIMLKS